MPINAARTAFLLPGSVQEKQQEVGRWAGGRGAGGRPPGSTPDHQLRKDRGNGQQGLQKRHLKGLQVSDSRLPQVRAGAPGQEHRAGLAM